MTPEPALLADILANPADDTLRLIYADFLEENGQGERAEFVRVQCRLAEIESVAPPAFWAELDRQWAQDGKLHDPKSCSCERHRLRRRERELLATMIDTSTPRQRRKERAEYLWVKEALGRHVFTWPFVFRRGFLAEITCPLSGWLEHGPRIVRCQPVEVVRVRDREPIALPADTYGSWWIDVGMEPAEDDQSDLPGEIFKLLPGGLGGGARRTFDSSEAAHHAISTACLAWAKSQAPVNCAPVRS